MRSGRTLDALGALFACSVSWHGELVVCLCAVALVLGFGDGVGERGSDLVHGRVDECI